MLRKRYISLARGDVSEWEGRETICSVLRGVKNAHPETTTEIDRAICMAKKMDTKLREYKENYADTMFPRKDA